VQGVITNALNGGKVYGLSSVLGAVTGGLSGATSVSNDAARG
jgi:outer membrane lipoprotein SlyB